MFLASLSKEFDIDERKNDLLNPFQIKWKWGPIAALYLAIF